MHLALVVAILAQVGTATVTPATPQSKGKAQAVMSKGTSLYEIGDIAGALEKFRAAYAIYPSSKLFFNIGQAHRDLGQPLESREAFNRFIVETRDAPESMVAEARKALSEVESKLGRVQITSSMRGWAIAIDGRSVGTIPLFDPIWLNPGQHQLSARQLPSSVEVAQTFSVIAGQTAGVTIEQRTPKAEGDAMATRPLVIEPVPTESVQSPREPVPAAVPFQPAPTDRSPSIVQEAPSSRKPPLPIWVPWAGAVTTVALVVSAVVAGQSANDRYNQLKSSCGQTAAGCTSDQMDSVRSRDHLTTTLWALSGVVAAATGVAVYVDTREFGITTLWRF